MKKYYEIYKLGNRLGLPKKDLKNFIETNKITEQPSLDRGGPKYPGNLYGAISIDDF